MLIKKVSVFGLFGELNHEIPMDLEEGLTFMFGLNGSGKTTTMNMLNSLFSMQFSALARLPFESLVVESNDGRSVSVRRVFENEGSVRADLLFNDSEPNEEWLFVGSRSSRPSTVSMVERFLPHLRRVRPREWSDRHTGERLSLEEVLAKYESELPEHFFAHKTDAPEWLTNYLQSVPVYFMRADRLYPNKDGREVSERRANVELQDGAPQTVDGFAEDLVDRIKSALAAYADFSQSLESSFPKRFLEMSNHRSVAESEEATRLRYEEQADRRENLVRIGILEAADDLTLPNGRVDPVKLHFLDAYFNDAELKLDSLSAFAQKLELFLEVVNSKLRRKQLVVDRKQGWRVEADRGGSIPLSALSSGEQQEIVLAYGLLFLEEPGTLVLIDEPELSLHVAWQFKLVPDFQRIADLTNLRFLIATHSPQVINGRDDITVYLKDMPES
jgi:predicted ATP-dependent endonuclease of OLD family